MNESIAIAVAAVLALALGLGGCRDESSSPGLWSRSARGPVLLFAAASTTSALDEIRRQFTSRTGIEVEASYASSATLAQQIVNGAGADVFLSADGAWADFVAKEGLQARRRLLLGNRLVVIVPADSAVGISGVEALTSVAVRQVAIADPQSAPAGKYARAALEKLGLWDKLKGKVAAGADVRQALAYVETGAAEAGIVYSTDAAASGKVKVACVIAEDLTGPVRYPLVLLARGKGGAAEEFYRHLGSPAAGAVFEKHGFVVLRGEGGAGR